jgi:hypothetical protein
MPELSLGFDVICNRRERKLFVSQHYIDAVLELFNIAGCKPVKAPLPTGFKSDPATDDEFADVHLDPAMVGSSCMPPPSLVRISLTQSGYSPAQAANGT